MLRHYNIIIVHSKNCLTSSKKEIRCYKTSLNFSFSGRCFQRVIQEAVLDKCLKNDLFLRLINDLNA